MRNRHHDIFFGDQIFDTELAFVTHDLGLAHVAERFGHVHQLGLENRHATLATAEDAAQFGDQRAHFSQLRFQLVDLETGQLGEAHVENRLGLPLRQRESRLQAEARRGRIIGRTDDLDHFVDVVDGDLQSFEDVFALERLVEIELRPAGDDFVAVVDVVLKHLAHRHHLRHQLSRLQIGHQREHDHAKRRLQLRVLVELIEHHARNRIALELHHQPDAFLVRLVAQRADAGDFAFAHEIHDLLTQSLLVDLIWNLSDDNLALAAAFIFFDLCARTHLQTSAARLDVILDARATIDETGRRKIRTGDDLPDLVRFDLRVVHHGHDCGRHLAQVVRRNVGRHAHGDAGAAVHQQVRQARGQHLRLLARVVEVRAEIHRAPIDVRQHLHRDARQPDFGVAIGGGVVTVDAAEVALAVHQRIAQRKLLHHAHHRVVHAAVAVRVVAAQHVADHGR